MKKILELSKYGHFRSKYRHTLINTNIITVFQQLRSNAQEINAVHAELINANETPKITFCKIN